MALATKNFYFKDKTISKCDFPQLLLLLSISTVVVFFRFNSAVGAQRRRDGLKLSEAGLIATS